MVVRLMVNGVSFGIILLELLEFIRSVVASLVHLLINCRSRAYFLTSVFFFLLVCFCLFAISLGRIHGIWRFPG